jgi:hypothetical protein
MSRELINWLAAQLDFDQAWASTLPPDHPGQIYNGSEWVQLPAGDRLLREVESKRRILARHEPIEVFGQVLCTYCGVIKGASRPDASWPCPDLRDLAEVYSDRAGYQEAWRP